MKIDKYTYWKLNDVEDYDNFIAQASKEGCKWYAGQELEDATMRSGVVHLGFPSVVEVDNEEVYVLNKDKISNRDVVLVDIDSRYGNNKVYGKVVKILERYNPNVVCEVIKRNDKHYAIYEDNLLMLYGDLLSEERCYLAAFRTNKEQEGNGYFSLLFDYLVDDLKSRGYNELCLGVSPKEVRNMEIYFHLGFRDYIKSTTQDNELILFYKKDI